MAQDFPDFFAAGNSGQLRRRTDHPDSCAPRHDQGSHQLLRENTSSVAILHPPACANRRVALHWFLRLPKPPQARDAAEPPRAIPPRRVGHRLCRDTPGPVGNVHTDYLARFSARPATPAQRRPVFSASAVIALSKVALRRLAETSSESLRSPGWRHQADCSKSIIANMFFERPGHQDTLWKAPRTPQPPWADRRE